MRPPPGAGEAGPARILIVEDDPATREGLALHLGSLGYQVAATGDGATALAAIQGEPPDVLLVDLVLPGGVDGIQVLQSAKAISPGVGAIIMTGHASTETTAQALRLGAYDYLTKPFDLRHLNRILTQLVDKLRLERRLRETQERYTRELERSLEDRRRELEALRTVTQAIRGLTSAPEILRVGLGCLLGMVTGAHLAWCYLREGQQEGLTPVDLGPGRRVFLGGYAHGCAIPEVLPVDLCAPGTCECLRRLAEMQAETFGPSVAPCARLEKLGVSASGGPPHHLSLPLVVRGETLGLLNLAKEGYAPFSSTEVALLGLLADQIAIGIADVRLQARAEAAFRELRESQRRTVRTEKLRAVGELASGVAHDFNNLLTAVLGSAQLLLRGERDPQRLEELRVIERAAKDGAETVRRILEFTRGRSDREAVPVDVCATAREAVELTRSRWRSSAQVAGATINLRLDLQPVPPIPGNPAELREMVTNLILNAVDAMPRGGTLSLSTRRVTWPVGPGVESPRSVEVEAVRATEGSVATDSTELDDVSAEQSGAWVELTISDTGVGMSSDVLDRIFDPFFTTKEGSGAGLGLSVAYGIVERHQGDILVTSTPGEGTSFAIRFPVAPAGESAAPARGVTAPPAAVPVRPRPVGERSGAGVSPALILVVDDEPILTNMLQSILEIQGHRVVTALSGAEAIERIRSHTFDLVLTDLGMPDVSGWDVAREVERVTPGVPVVLVTGWGMQISPEEATQACVSRVIQKPYTFETVHGVIADLLGQQPRRWARGGPAPTGEPDSPH
ncbi:MAG TPA: response regulator [Candidatus Methylomirabilis sp.]|nr:response regulator [Candidatus Methylomirabilis sp.]